MDVKSYSLHTLQKTVVENVKQIHLSNPDFDNGIELRDERENQKKKGWRKKNEN